MSSEAVSSDAFSLHDALEPQVKTYVAMNYYDLRRKVLLGLPNELPEILLALECSSSINGDFLIKGFQRSRSPVDAVKLIEELERRCKK